MMAGAALAAALGLQAMASRSWALAPDPQLLAVPQHVIDTGNQAPLIRYNRYLSGGAHTHGAWNGGWQIPMALAAWGDNTAADARLLQQINYNLQGTNAISANGGYPAQHELHVTGMYAILRQSDRFWNTRLTADQRHKIDLVMKAAVVASAYTTADATYAAGHQHTAIDGDTNLHRGWNPNFREGMFGNLIQGMVYFGGAEPVKQILSNYNHAAFVAELQQAGLSNTHETFTWSQANPGSGAPSGTKIEQHIRNYTYQGQPLTDPFDLYTQLTLNTYNRLISPGLNDGAGQMGSNGVLGGFVVSGQDALPNRGVLGMLTEFQAQDASGPRSSMVYAYDGFRPNLTNHLSVLIGGYWQEGDAADEMLRRLDVGITDMIYKLEHGYRNYAHGRGTTDVFDINRPNWDWSFRTTIPLWTEVLRPFHLGDSQPPDPPPGRITSRSTWQSFGLGEAHDQPLIISFDAIPHANQMDGVIGILRDPASHWTDLAAIFRFNPSGRMDVRNGGVYAADLVAPYAAGTVYHVIMEIDPAAKTYSVFVTPEGGERILLADGYAFRTEQSLTDMLDHWALWHGQGSFGIDNFAVRLAAALAGDTNLDGRVDGEDFLIWQANFGMASGANWGMGDFNGDGRVDGEDFLIWQANFGAVSNTAVTPEPSMLCLLLAGGLMLRRRFSRS